MEIKQLRYFIACADAGSISNAAKKLYTTQPNVSRVIQELEGELGFELFIRHRSGIRLTESGKQVYSNASKILVEINKIYSMEKNEQKKVYLYAVYLGAGKFLVWPNFTIFIKTKILFLKYMKLILLKC